MGRPSPLQLIHTSVAVQANHKNISKAARLLQNSEMAGMQQFETTIGEDDAAAVAFLAAKLQNRFFDSQNPWVQRNSMKARAKSALVLSERLVYHAQDAQRFGAGRQR